MGEVRSRASFDGSLLSGRCLVTDNGDHDAFVVLAILDLEDDAARLRVLDQLGDLLDVDVLARKRPRRLVSPTRKKTLSGYSRRSLSLPNLREEVGDLFERFMLDWD